MKQALSIAGYDSNGSAGLTADLHSFYADGVYGHGVLTGVVAENASQITASQTMPASFVAEEFKDLAEFHITASKTGMLANQEIIQTVAQYYAPDTLGPLVVDPVIVTKRQDRLLSDDAFNAFCQQIIPLATVLTPNFIEAQELLGSQLTSQHDVQVAAHDLQKMGARNVVIKGQHQGEHTKQIHNYVLLANGDDFWMDNNFVKTAKLNGAGDSFSAIITAELAQEHSVEHAIKRANNFVDVAIHHPLAIGKKFGPINHWAGQESLHSPN